jgi:adenylate kinase family enzyme
MINNCVNDGNAIGVIMLGPINSGRNTQARMLVDVYEGHHISTGVLVRGRMDIDEDFRRQHGLNINKGLPVPDDVILSLIAEHTQKNELSGIIALSGWSRTKHQADMLHKIFTKPHHVIAFDFMISLTIARERARLSGRVDSDEVIKRFRLWQTHRDDVAHKLRAKGVHVVGLDGCHNPDHIHDSVRGTIVKHVKALKGLVGVRAPSRHRHPHHAPDFH